MLGQMAGNPSQTGVLHGYSRMPEAYPLQIVLEKGESVCTLGAVRP